MVLKAQIMNRSAFDAPRRHGQNDERADCISEGGDASNRSVVPSMKTKSASHCGCSILRSKKSIQPSRPWSLSTNLTALCKHVLGNQSNGQCDQSRNNDQSSRCPRTGIKSGIRSIGDARQATTSSHRASRGVRGCRIAALYMESCVLNSRVIWSSRFVTPSSYGIQTLARCLLSRINHSGVHLIALRMKGIYTRCPIPYQCQKPHITSWWRSSRLLRLWRRKAHPPRFVVAIVFS
jgi:hypothetical protein